MFYDFFYVRVVCPLFMYDHIEDHIWCVTASSMYELYALYSWVVNSYYQLLNAAVSHNHHAIQ